MARRNAVWAGLTLAVVAAGLLWLRPANLLASSATATTAPQPPLPAPQWSPAELGVIRSLSLRNLPALPPSESNRYAHNEQAARLGKDLFFDQRLSGNGQVACASCHQPQRDFADGRPRGVGIDAVDRHTMSLIGVAYSPWLFWDGRADSLWSQALGPLEDAREHGGTRTHYVHVIARYYRERYETVFGSTPAFDQLNRLPASAGPLGNLEELAAWERMDPADRDAVNRIFANIGKAMEAYQRRLLPAPTRFDAYVDALIDDDRKRASELLTQAELHGLRVFIGSADCTHCHNGPLLSNNDFHNTAVATADENTLAEGRVRGVARLRHGGFSCLGDYSDAGPRGCLESRFVKAQGAELMSAFRTPSLRNVARTAPYMHNGRFTMLDEIIEHYAAAPPSVLGRSELVPLALSAEEKMQLVAFLRTLDEQPSAVNDPWRQAP